MIIVPTSKKSNIELDSYRRIYNWENPHNTLPFFLYIPFIDPTNVKYYPYLYVMEAYWSVLLSVQVAVSFANFALSPYSLKAHYEVLNKYTEMLGTVHLNKEGKRVLYRDIMKAEFIEVDVGKKSKKIVHRNKRINVNNLMWYDYYYLTKIIEYHQKMIFMRKQVRVYITVSFRV